MKINKTPESIWHEYNKGVQYNDNINLYDTVEDNENYYNGNQWKNVKGKGLDKPVFNFIKEATNFYVATLISDDIGVSINIANSMGEDDAVIPDILKAEIDRIMERANVKYKNRKSIRNCVVDGDMCMYFWFNPDVETGFKYKGEIECEIIDNTNVLFADPSTEDVESQPYIILAYRLPLCVVKDMAEENGVNPDDIKADAEYKYMNSDRNFDNEYTTVLIKFWKEDTVHFMKTTRECVLVDDTDTKLSRYPITYMSWESEKNSYHGISPITAVKPNQRFVNKLYAMAMEYIKKMAFPKLLYDRAKLPQGITNDIGKAIGVIGNPNEALFSNFQGADMSSQVMQIITNTIQQTKEQMGAYDTALGNVNPDNTSAIIATQQSASAPLDIQRLNFYNFIEDYFRIWIDMMRVYYGKRFVTIEEVGTMEFDFSKLKDYCFNLKVDIGRANQWSEIIETQTIDNLIQMGVFQGDPELIIEMIPKANLRSKDRILRLLRQRMQMQQEQMMQQQMMEQGGNVEGESGLNPNELSQIASEIATLDPTEQTDVLNNLGVSDADKQRIANAMN